MNKLFAGLGIASLPFTGPLVMPVISSSSTSSSICCACCLLLVLMMFAGMAAPGQTNNTPTYSAQY